MNLLYGGSKLQQRKDEYIGVSGILSKMSDIYRRDFVNIRVAEIQQAKLKLPPNRTHISILLCPCSYDEEYIFPLLSLNHNL
jgi:hypothetical protein